MQFDYPKLPHKDLEKLEYKKWKRFLDQTSLWSIKEIQNYQTIQLKKIISYAFNKSKGYKKLFTEHGINVKDLDSLKDITKIPFTTKEMFRDKYEEFSTQIKERFYTTTSGSTGIPLGMYRDPISFAKELASKAHQYERVGWYEGCRQMVFRGLPINTPDHTEYFPEYNELRCSSYYLIPEQMEIYRKKAWEFKPDFIKCYPSSGYIFAKFLKDSNASFPPIKSILCASENLYEHQKKLLSETFKCRVFSHYGHQEMSTLAGFCELEDTYHVLPHYGYTELLDKNGKIVNKKGEVGEIVSTSFIMKATPFIRYRTMDLAVYGGDRCRSCDRPYQIWKRIEGRSQEFVATINNRYISMTSINMHDDIFDQLYQFQFFQKKKGEVTFNYLPKKKLNKKSLNQIKEKLHSKFEHDIILKTREVSEIPPTANGKYKFLIQKIDLKLHE